jgi:hypothetical protein
VFAPAQAAEAVGEALPPTMQTVQAYGIPGSGQLGNLTVIRGDRVIRDHLVVMGRSLWWTQLTEEGGWMVQVVDEAGQDRVSAWTADSSTDGSGARQVGRDHADPGASGVLAHRPCHRG